MRAHQLARPHLRWLAAMLLAALALTALLNTFHKTGGRTDTSVVVGVYDGDTIQVSGLGKVRLIGVDALDAYNVEKLRTQSGRLGLPASAGVAWSQKATDFARRRLLGRKVTLRFGPEGRDDYGRVLAYVYPADGQEDPEVSFNELLLTEGLAVAYRGFSHPLRERFVEAENDARRRRAGMWRRANSPAQP